MEADEAMKPLLKGLYTFCSHIASTPYGTDFMKQTFFRSIFVPADMNLALTAMNEGVPMAPSLESEAETDGKIA